LARSILNRANIEHRTPNIERQRGAASVLYGEVERIEGLLLQMAGAFAEFGNRKALGNFHDSLAHFFHHTADGAAGFIRAGALPARDTSPALYYSGGFQIVQDLFEETLRNVLLFGNGLNAND